MLHIKEVKKYSQRLENPAGKEVWIRPLDQGDFARGPIYVKYGRELSKHDPSSAGMTWNETVFDTALNHPRRPWTVVKTEGGKAMVLVTTKKGLGVSEEDPVKVLNFKGGEDLDEDSFQNDNSSILLINNIAKEFAFGLEDSKDLTWYAISARGGKLSLVDEINTVEGSIVPVMKQDGSMAYIAVNNGPKSVMYKMNEKGLQKSQKIQLNVASNAEKIMLTRKGEILHISPQGLNVYTADGSSTKFKYFCPFFSASGGWRQPFVDSISLMQIENDQEALIGTGPKGIEYFPISEKCKNYVIEGADDFKHALIAGGATKNGNQIKVLGFYNGELSEIILEVQELTELKLYQDPVPEAPQKHNKATKNPNFTVRSGNSSKSTRWLRDSVDEASFKNIVDKLTGKVQFSFPLIDLQDRMGLPIKLMVYYSESDSEDMSVLGRYWTLGKDCIVLDHGNTVFEDKQDYFLVKDQMKVKLERDWTKLSTEGKLSFYLSSYKSVVFEYTVQDEKWEVNDGKIRYVYGIKNQGVVSVPGWSDWYGPSAKFDQSKSHAIQWNLIEISSVAFKDVKIKYTYTALDTNANSMHLASISDGDKTNIKFGYKTIKVVDEQHNSGLVKEHSFINNKLLEKVDVETVSISQSLKIASTQIGSLHYLESISQEGDSDPVLSFKYNKEDQLKPRISQIQLPSKAVLDFQYSNQTVETDQFIQEIDQFADLYTGNEYSLQITKQPGETNFIVDIRDSSGKNEFVKAETMRIESYEGFMIKSYSPIIMRSYFAVVVDYYGKGQGKDEKEVILNKIYIFNKGDGGRWNVDNANQNSRVINDKSFKYDFQEESFVYYHSNKIHFEYRKAGIRKWNYASQDIGETSALALINRGAIYWKDDLIMTRWDSSGAPKQTTLSDPQSKATVSDIDTFYQYMDIQGTYKEDVEGSMKEVEDYKRDLKKLLCSNGLVLYNNLVALRTVKMNSQGKISIKVFLYLLKGDYSVSSRSSIDMEGEDITKFNLTLDVFDEYKTSDTSQLDKYRFAFKKESDKYKMKFTGATDKNDKPTEPSKENEQLIEQYERRMKIPLDFEKYMMQVNHDGIILNNHQIIHNNGKFEAQALDRDTLKLTKFRIPLGTFSNIKKNSNADNIMFCTQTDQQTNENCIGLDINTAQNVSIKYPFYLVTQKRNGIKVLPLKINSRGWEDPVDYEGEILHISTSHSVLVTTRISDKKTIVRPLKSLNKNKKAYAQVVSTEKLSTPIDEYQIKYEYYNPVVSMNDIAFKTTVVVPGGDKTVTGYYREKSILHANEQVVEVMTTDDQVFDPEYIKRMNQMQEEEQKQRGQVQLEPNRTISDRSGSHPILKTTPYSVQQNLVHFIAFEDYEDSEGWTVSQKPVANSSSIRRNEFSATGRNFLLLKKGEELVRELSDTPYYDVYIASAWIRTAQEVFVGSQTDMISIYVDNQQIKGTVKQSIEEWIYVEAVTSSIEVTESNSVKKVTLKVVVKPSGADDIHVDHVRISPMNFKLEANVYDSHIGQRTAQIQNNGYVSRRLYDAYNRRIAEVDENGNVKYMVSYSKRTGNTKESDKKLEGGNSSRVQIQPRRSWLESFSPYTVDKRWTVTGDATVEPYSISLKGQMTFNYQFSSESFCVRMVYSLTKNAQITLIVGKVPVTINVNSIQYKGASFSVASSAELIVFVTPKLTSIWVNGHLGIESPESNAKFNNESISLQATKTAQIKDLIIMEDAEIQVSYMNRDSKPVQEILMLDSSNILIRQIMYDTIGRKVAETVWTQKSLEDQSSQKFKALQYHEDFVTNDNPDSDDYFLKSGPMKGFVSEPNAMYDGYPYSQTQYFPNPLEVRYKVGQPGLQYSIRGNLSQEFSIASDLPFIQKFYPKNEGYHQEQQNKPIGKKHVVVYNRRNKKVAEYTQVKDYNNILTTYVYDEYGNQIQMLPPNYYGEQLKNSSEGFKPEKVVVQSPWAVNSTYDETGELITSKVTPDGGRVDFIYNEYKQLRYQLHYGENNKVDKIVYFLYNVFGRVCEAGQVLATPEIEKQVRETTKSHDAIPNHEQAVYFDYGETESDPSLRGRIQRTVKKNKDVTFSEVLYFDDDSNVIRKTYISSATNDSMSLEYLQQNGKVDGLRYPYVVDGQEMVLKYKHNLRGEIIEVSRVVGKSGNQIEFQSIAAIDHDAEGKVTRISHQYGEKNFTQTYKYGVPGYLTAIENDFLTENLYITEKGYGGNSTGDGSILRTEFKASWHDKCDQNLIPLTARAFVTDKVNLNLAETCFDALFNLGYIDSRGRPVKTFYPDLETKLPWKCSTAPNWRHISEMLLIKGYPEHYGHAYDYGSHGELIAAKSFVGQEKDNLDPPLTKDAFKEAGFRTTKDLDEFWNGLKNDISKIEGTRALFERSQNLQIGALESVIHRHKLKTILEGKGSDPLICSNWTNRNEDDRKCKKEFQSIFNSLNLKAIFSKLDKNLQLKVLKILEKSLATVLGNSPGDVESFSIDPNGNHGIFYTGFKRFELKYKPKKNQIDSIKEGTQDRMIVHDSEGNVIKALHKNIEKFEYDPLTQRVSRIELVDKSLVLEFGYDFRGERTLKRVRNQNNEPISELYYVRDNKGNVLVEYKQEYTNPKQPTKPITTVTAYIHGPLGLLGFFRNNKYYNVLLDHEGSTRLVIHNGKVVAAYDYLPYGQMMRKYGSNPEAHISFRYTGQEFDEETGLYNYHARIYDPDIGRFFQMDPMEQYASPYKYAGNSPVSQIDPDGQIAITLTAMAIGALIGAYLGAASANNSWNPAKWAWADKKTWIGLFAGAFMGAFAVYGGVHSFTFFTAMFGKSMIAGALATGAISVAGAFLGAAAASNEWNPAKWDWTSPAVWNGLLTGASVATSFPSGFVGISRSFLSLISATTKVFYALLMTSGFLLFVYVGGAMSNNFNFRMSEWDWKSPRTWFGMIEGASTIFIGAGATAKHGVAKVHTIVKPAKMKIPWYKINIPKKSYTLKFIKDEVIVTWYRNGQKVSKEILKIHSKTDMARIPQKTFGMTKQFYMPYHRIGYSFIAIPTLGYLTSDRYKSFFGNHLNGTLTKPVRRKRFAWMASSAAGLGISSFLNELFRYVADVFTSFFIQTENQNILYSDASIEIAKKLDDPANDLPNKSFQKLCYSPDGEGNQIICPQRESMVNVFSKLSKFDPELFGHDSFSKCLPLTWHDRPSIVCDGQQTTFVYTPVQSLRMFDLVDGWLMLARIAPAAVRNLKAGFSFLKSVFIGGGGEQIKSMRHEMDVCKEVLDSKLLALKNALKSKKMSAVKWAEPILYDLEEDIGDFVRNKHSTQKEFEFLQERLNSLRDDVLEESGVEYGLDLTVLLREMLMSMNDQDVALKLNTQLTSLTDGLTSQTVIQLLK